jgi:RHH-type proline utilization regulon transcriptional repressor/proline dehydrogenase/delta 1-pyrroline-5-carboxylate dehydrogenase
MTQVSRPCVSAIEEREVQRIGKLLFSALGRRSIRDPQEIFSNLLMSLAMDNDARRVALLRFVDVLPTLKTSESLIRHLTDYLLQPDIPLPPIAERGLSFGTSIPLARPLLAGAVRTGVSVSARRFIAGPTAENAMASGKRLRSRSLAATFDLLGEAITSEAEAVAYQKQYMDLLPALTRQFAALPANDTLDNSPHGKIPRVNISLKLSCLTSRFDPMAASATSEAVKERLRPILSLARESRAFVNIDMEQNAFASITLRIFREILDEDEYRDWPDVGIVVQAYRKEAEEDLLALKEFSIRRGTPIWVRLVKGAYWDYETIIAAQKGLPVPVFERKTETDANYERLATILLENWRYIRPAFATHNVRSAAYVLSAASALNIPKRALEFQVLLGMGEPLGRALESQGQRVRVYVPFGELLPGMAYLVRRLLENTSNDSFLRGASQDSASIDLLLAPPQPYSGPLDKFGSTSESSVKTGFRNEPETDFDLEQNQNRMLDALKRVKQKLGEAVPVIVDGHSELSITLTDRLDPSNAAQVASRISYATMAQANRAVAAAQAAFPSWRDVSVLERSALLRRTADILTRRRFEIAAWQVFEVGKPWRDADADVAEAIDFCRFYASEMERLAAPRLRDVPGETNVTIYDARGPAVIIAPWNFPLAILTGMSVAALVTGNPVVIKPAEQASRIGLFLVEALQEAGAPRGVVNFLPGIGEEVGPTLINHPDVALIAFTGSKAVGLSILHNASTVQPGQREIRRVIAELGGKNVIIIDEDADMDEAIQGALASAIGFAGQKCSACSRIIVIGSAYEPFCARFAEAVRSIIVGPAEDPATMLGPVVDSDAQSRILRYIEAGRNEGRLLAESPLSEALSASGAYVPAAVFVDCPMSGSVWQEEIFGPVIAVRHANSLTEALEHASNSEYALTAGFYSRSPQNISRVRNELRVGNLYINRKITGALVDRQPFGGLAMSGVGMKAGGSDYLPQFLNARTITESVLRRGFAPATDGGEG